MRLRPGLLPKPCWGAYSAPQTPYLVGEDSSHWRLILTLCALQIHVLLTYLLTLAAIPSRLSAFGLDFRPFGPEELRNS